MPLGHTFFSTIFSAMCWSQQINTLSMLFNYELDSSVTVRPGLHGVTRFNHEALGSIPIIAPHPSAMSFKSHTEFLPVTISFRDC